MQIPDAFVAELRSRVSMRELVGRKLGLKPSGRIWMGLCCFHDERTPSFAVYDDHATCFGCGWRGDAIQFVQDTERVGFRDAVERLAASVGMEVPTDPAEVARMARLGPLYQLLDDHAELWHARLLGPSGAAALAYLRGRGLTDDVVSRWRIGWGDGIVRHDEVDSERVVGLNRNRILFPVQDVRGRIVGFSGRVLGNSGPKYINTAETQLFRKRELLYGLPQARAMDGARGGLLIVEGQLDVIAVQEVGIPAVAPLGTALTVEQLQAAWRVCSCPTLCFDGDVAGGRAAGSAIMTALPHITPERTLSVATMPLGRDPDALVRTDGASAMQEVVRLAAPLVDALYAQTGEPAKGASPETWAAFKDRLVSAAAKIQHRGLATEYRKALLNRAWERSRRRPERTNAVVVMPVPVNTPRLRYLSGAAEDVDLAKAAFDQAPTPEHWAKLVAFQAARNEIMGMEFSEGEVA